MFASAYLRVTPVASAKESLDASDLRVAGSLKSLLTRTGQLRARLADLQEELASRLEAPSGSGKSTSNVTYTAVTLQSSGSLGLNATTTPTTLRSTSEINAIATSYTPFGPSFAGGSTSLATLGGTYDGLAGDDVLTFTVRKAGNVGGPYTGKRGTAADLAVEVRNKAGARLQDLRFTEALAPDTPIQLSNGLTVKFSAGSLLMNDSFQVSVSSTVPSTVNPNLPVDGTRNSDPNFEPAYPVTAGSFTVNGTAIAVQSGDSIQAVLARITQSAAGVTAAFDAATERILLTQTTPGSAGPIVLANDTSGFLAATKLSRAVAVPGTDPEINRPLSQVAAFAGLNNGNFTLNGVTFSVDRANDTLNDLLTRINESAAGVTATWSSDRLTLQSKSAPASLALDDGTSGFFTAVHLSEGTYEPESRTVSTVAGPDGRALAHWLAGEFNALSEELQALFAEDYDARLEPLLGAARDRIFSSVGAPLAAHLGYAEREFGAAESVNTRLGFTFSFGEASLELIHTNEGQLRRALAGDLPRVREFLMEEPIEETRRGLLPSLVDAVKDLEGEWQARLGLFQGIRLDELA